MAILAGPAMMGSASAAATSCAAGQLCTASGADVDRLTPVVESYVGRFLQQNGITGATVGISWNGRRTYFGYGYGDRAQTRPFDAETIVEIGSITKVFTTALLQEAVADNRLQLDGQLRTYQSLLTRGPLKWCAGLKTLRELADFSSGMPRLPDGIASPAPDIRTYTVPDFLNWLSGWKPTIDASQGDAREACAKPAPYLYSNASVGLLGILLADVYRKPWDVLVDERITGPLGMGSTFVAVPAAQAYRTAQGYDADNEVAPAWPIYAWYAAGVLRSDAHDMLSFGEAALGSTAIDGRPAQTPPVLKLEAALSQAMAPVYQATQNGTTFGQGLAWEQVLPRTSQQAPLSVKNGGTSGFNSVIVVNPAKALAVFVAFPKHDSNAQSAGIALTRHIGSGD